MGFILVERRMTDNDRDVELLRSNPHALLLKYQETIRIIVKKYIEAGMFKAPEFEDIVQEINASILAKIPAMQRQYNGRSLFKTYFSVIVRNICLKAHRRGQKDIDFLQEDLSAYFVENSHEKRSVIEHEVSRFRTVLSLYDRQRPKLLLCLKLYFRIPMTPEDIRLWYPECSGEDQAILMGHFGRKYDQLSDIDIYKIVTPIMNRNEKRSNSVDAIRKWTDSKVREIIDLLNKRPKRTNHSVETLKILVDDFFSPFLLER
jgi:DNA-directed RNA polymerase specialized sigma24 family protein